MTGRRLDEGDFRARPSRRGSRPRTKQRPEHADAERGLVTGVDRGRYTLLMLDDVPEPTGDGEPASPVPGLARGGVDAADPGGVGGGERGAGERAVGEEHRSGERAVGGRRVVAMRARELGRGRIVVGDRVDVVGDTSGEEGTLARIVRVAERTTVLRRTADDTDPYERVVVANADQLAIVTALAEPEPRTRMIDRCVVAAYDAGMDALLVLTKADLAPADELRALYEPLGVRVVVTRRAGGQIEGLDALHTDLAGRVTVMVGHSGVGKSTLVNALVPTADRATGVVNDVTGRGRHTSTSAVALRMPAGHGAGAGWVVDTPGVRSFGLAHVTADTLLAAFGDLADVAAECPRGCRHLADAPDCALDEWVEEADDGEERAGRAARTDSFRRLLAARTDTVAT